MSHLNNVTKSVLIIFLIALFQHETIAINIENALIRRIVIDAGHGGVDPGALGNKAKEKDIVLSIALKVGQLINSHFTDVQVIYTRNDDSFIPLMDRADIANKNKADLFISIHANASTNTSTFGVETYAMGLHTSEKNFEVAKKENAVITLEKDYSSRYEGFDPNSAESYITFSLMQNTFLDQSLNFASFVQEQFSQFAHRTDKGVKQAGFLVLWKTSMPAVLIEVGFISNPDEEAFLMSEAGQDKIAQSVYKSFCNYKKSIETSVNISLPQKQINIDTPIYSSKNKHKTKGNKDITSADTNSLQNSESSIQSIQSNDSITYRVQLTSSAKPINLNNAFFKHCKKINNNIQILEFKTPDSYKYTIGFSLTYNEISEQNKIIKNYYPNAFIVALKNGNFIPVSEARKITRE
jgi:N-acetylmuramoyl-L-alanine amidase